MRRILLLFLLLLQIGTIYAQKDTVRYGDPWYQFNPLSTHTSYFPPTSHWRQVLAVNDIQVYSNINAKFPVYGIAFVADTDAIKDRHERPDSSRFKAILYDSVSEWDDVYHYINAVALDTAFFDSFTRLCFFEYRYNYEQEPYSPNSTYNPGTLLSPCFELYFDKPYMTYWDAICVGRYEGDWGVTDTSDVWLHRVNYIRDSASNSAYYHTNGSGTFAVAPPGYYAFIWGGMFPIVKLRCTRPRQVHETERGSDRLTIAWQGHDETSDFQVRIYAAGTPADSVDPVDVSGTSYVFTELVPDVNYLYSVRKRCHYATDSYDTIVYSEWYPPQQLRLVGIDEVGAPRFSLSPNPASETVVVTFAKPADGCRMELYDASGRQVDSQAVADGATTATLDVRRHAAGVYLLKTVSPAGATVRKLVVR